MKAINLAREALRDSALRHPSALSAVSALRAIGVVWAAGAGSAQPRRAGAFASPLCPPCSFSCSHPIDGEPLYEVTPGHQPFG